MLSEGIHVIILAYIDDTLAIVAKEHMGRFMEVLQAKLADKRLKLNPDKNKAWIPCALEVDETLQRQIDVTLEGLEPLGSAIEGENRSFLCAEGLRVAPAKVRLESASRLSAALVSMAHAPLGVPASHGVVPDSDDVGRKYGV